MSLSVSASSGDSNYELTPEGTYIAKCFKIIDLGTQTVEWQGVTKFQKKVMITWELLDDKVVMKDGKPFAATKTYTASLDERGNLRKDLEAWRGKKFTDAELASFDLKAVLGAYCMIQIVHSEDGKYANVNAIMSTKEKPAGVNEPVSFDVDDPDLLVFGKLSERMQEKIKLSPEWRAWNAKDEPAGEPITGSEEDHNENDPFADFGDAPIDVSNIPF